MPKQVELSELEIGIIVSALNAHWNSAHHKLECAQGLGDIEKKLLEQQKALTYPVLAKFENL
jgi:hypothetical protein